MKHNNFNIMIAAAVSLGGFLFGFDAAVISGVTGFIVPEFGLSDIQLGWVVSSLTAAATTAMLTSGPLSDRFGRRKLLLYVGLLYSVSAIGSAIAPSYPILVIARMIGGFAVGASLILAPLYIAEVSPAENRGKMVSIQQLNIVLGFSAAYFSNFYLLQFAQSGADLALELQLETEVWRWMLGVESIPALLFFLAMIWVPESPRWLMMKERFQEANKILTRLHSTSRAEKEFDEIKESLDQHEEKVPLSELFKPAMKLVLIIGVTIGILQQITGVNAIYFYATTIFEQSGVGRNAAYAQAVWIGIINVVFTLVAMFLIDRVGRKPILLVGIAGVAISMFITAYGFHQASYQLDQTNLPSVAPEMIEQLQPIVGQTFDDDVAFKNALKESLGEETYPNYESMLIEEAITMNPVIVLVGILGFVASFAVSLGPVMWVLLSEIFPTAVRGIAISFVGFINSAVSFLVQLVFPWELSNLGNTWTYLIFGLFAVVGFVMMLRMLPETKGRSLEELEKILVKE